jgi:FtsP/CotA-like multicopper oxidase with cupredoxin domain
MLFMMFTSVCQQDINLLLIARNTGKKVLANNDTVRVFGFAQSLSKQPNVPGPTIYANEGDSVHIDLWNVSQGAPHTIHLHGLDVDQQNDGVPHLSFDVPHMEHGFYHFKAPHAGTYLYHCHVASTIHVHAGMYGLIIIRPSDGSNTTWNGGHTYVQEHAYILSEIDTTWLRDSVLLHRHDTSVAITEVKLPKYDPQFFLINGFSDQQLADEEVKFESNIGQVDYIRFANVGYCGLRVIFPPELDARIISSDGRPFDEIEKADTVYLYPGERYGVLTEPRSEFKGQIRFEYLDLNTMRLRNTQMVPVNVNDAVGVHELNENEFPFKILPNPSSQEVKIEFELERSANVKIRILSLQGKLIMDMPYQEFHSGLNSFIIEKAVLIKGVYMAQLSIEGLGFSTRELIRL